MRTREEHLQFCKDRAHEYLAEGDLPNAVTSMLSDLQRHPETRFQEENPLVMFGLMAAMNNNREEVRRFIDGFR